MLLVTACAEPTREGQVNSAPMQWTLPPVLREASGLALAQPGFLYTHNDESGDIYRVSINNGSVVKTASISWPSVKADYEGIAMTPRGLFLVTSNGHLYQVDEFNPDQSNQVVGARRISTGLGKRCELEGLHFLDGKLLMPCKEALKKPYRKRLVVFAFDLETEEVSEFLSLAAEDVEGINRFPSTAIDATNSHFYIISENHLIMVDRETHAASSIALNDKLHRQVEGLSIMEDGTILLVEDRRRGISKLTRYQDLDQLIALNQH